jgi:hypothetical protein
MPRGGYQKPKGAQAASGPGKFSKRTDAQKVQTPGLSGSDLQYGDVQRLKASQQVAPLPNGVPTPSPARQMQGTPLQSGKLPSYLFQTPTATPDVPDTTGLSSGPGAGPESLQSSEPSPDVREIVMQRIYEVFGSSEAAQWLADYRASKGGPTAPAEPAGEMT